MNNLSKKKLISCLHFNQSNYVTNSLVINKLEYSTVYFCLSGKKNCKVVLLSTELKQIAKSRTISSKTHSTHRPLFCFSWLATEVREVNVVNSLNFVPESVAVVITTSLR